MLGIPARPFRMKDSLPVVKRAAAVVSDVGGTPTIRVANGGLGELDGSPRCSDGDLWRRAERGAHD